MLSDDQILQIVKSNLQSANDETTNPEYNDPEFPEWNSFAAYRNNACDTVKEKGGSEMQIEDTWWLFENLRKYNL